VISAWSKADLHIHTIHSSDGTASVGAVLEHAARRTDLRVIAITDHDAIAGALEAQRLAPSYGVEVVVGEEVSTREGHLLALFISEHLPPRRPAAETIAAVHAQGGLCFPAHPCAGMVPSMGRRGLARRCAGPSPDWPVDGLEAFNASLWHKHTNLRAASIAGQLGLAAIGGSDSHHLATIGMGYTLFPGHTAAHLRAALEARVTRAEGRPWQWSHNAEVLGLWLRVLAQRARGTYALSE
jgi:predicted metal-dependent phosphoesterase TrpH